MKHLLLAVVTLGLCACAGNPPDWWNPSGTYGAQGTKAVSQKTGASSAQTAKPAEEIPAEESIDTTFEEYEELSLADTGEVKQSSLTETKADTTDATEQADPMYTTEENLPADGSLPQPTVLE
ncbi:MAG: hypothetical protein J6U96_01860 [Elusimicrobiaceae bacterium]|nr:hypothetical protein [Elusimicrobiaceae bacterium]